MKITVHDKCATEHIQAEEAENEKQREGIEEKMRYGNVTLIEVLVAKVGYHDDGYIDFSS